MHNMGMGLIRIHVATHERFPLNQNGAIIY